MHKTFLAVVVLSGASTGLAAQFQTLETSRLRLIYTTPLQSYLVPQVSRSFQSSLQFYCRLYDYKPMAGSPSCCTTSGTTATPARARCRRITSRSGSSRTPTNTSPRPRPSG